MNYNKNKISILVGLGLVLIVLLAITPVQTAPQTNYTEIANNLAINIEFNTNNLGGISRDFNTVYWNNYSYPIIVSTFFYCSANPQADSCNMYLYINNTIVQEYYLDNMNQSAYQSIFFTVYSIIPANSNYKLQKTTLAEYGIGRWYEYNMTIKAK